MSKFEMPMFDGIKTFDDEHGDLAKMFRFARYGSGGTISGLGKYGSEKPPEPSSASPSFSNPGQYTYRPYPAPWSPPPPVTPPTTGGPGGAGGVGSGGGGSTLRNTILKNQVPGMFDNQYGSNEDMLRRQSDAPIAPWRLLEQPGINQPNQPPGYGPGFVGTAPIRSNQPQTWNLFQGAQDQVAQNQPALGSSGGTGGLTIPEQATAAISKKFTRTPTANQPALGSSGGLQTDPNQQWQAGLPAFNPGGPDDPAMGGTGYMGGGPVGIRGAPGMVGGSTGGDMDMVEQWKNSFNPDDIFNPYKTPMTPTLPVMDKNTLAAMLKQRKR